MARQSKSWPTSGQSCRPAPENWAALMFPHSLWCGWLKVIGGRSERNHVSLTAQWAEHDLLIYLRWKPKLGTRCLRSVSLNKSYVCSQKCMMRNYLYCWWFIASESPETWPPEPRPSSQFLVPAWQMGLSLLYSLQISHRQMFCTLFHRVQKSEQPTWPLMTRAVVWIVHLELSGAAADVGIVMGELGQSQKWRKASLLEDSLVLWRHLWDLKTSPWKEAVHWSTEARRGTQQHWKNGNQWEFYCRWPPALHS